MHISLVVITLNEAEKLGDCLKSVAGLADEMLVVDSGSTDGTQALAESLGARVVHRPFNGHIEQKNAAAQLAQHDWVLSLDADERLDAEARSEIAGLKLQGAQKAAYGWRRLNHYGEQAYSAWGLVSGPKTEALEETGGKMDGHQSARPLGMHRKRFGTVAKRAYTAFFV